MNLFQQYDIRKNYESMNDFEKLKFLEEVRFMLFTTDYEFNNYFFKENLEEYEFYTMLDKLNSLGNSLMTQHFIEKHKSILLNDLNDNYVDFNIDTEQLLNLNTRLKYIENSQNAYSF